MIAGVGPRTRERLLRELGSLAMIKSATENELINAGANRKQAAAIIARFASSSESSSSIPEEQDEATHTAERDALDNAFDSVLTPNS